MQSRFIFRGRPQPGVHAFDHPGREGGREEERVGDKNAPTNGPLDCGYQGRRERNGTRKERRQFLDN